MRAAIITIGTEITSGQIFDRNSRWISQKLENLDIQTVLHVSVPDQTELMLAAFQFAEDNGELLFICGGLGPTSDDFTRDAISEFTGRLLQTDAPSMAIIEEKLNRRALTIMAGHRRQALLPQGALALDNEYGVAPGFYMEHGKIKIWALPGPPKEIEAIWDKHIATHLHHLPKDPQRLKLKTWLCLNIVESEIARITEEFFTNYDFKKQFGYRIQLPYVEVKLWYDDKHSQAAPALAAFTETIKESFVASTTAEVYRPFLDFLKNIDEIVLIDHFSEGLYLQRLQEILPPELQKTLQLKYSLGIHADAVTASADLKNKKQLFLEIKAQEKEACWQMISADKSQKISVTIPTRRSGQYAKLYVLEKMLLSAFSIDAKTSS